MEEKIIGALKKAAVKISTKHDENTVHIGSGITVLEKENLYVLTVTHCIYGKKNEYNHSVKMADIEVVTEDQKNLHVKQIDDYKNIVCLTVENSDHFHEIINGFPQIKYLDKAYFTKKYYFRGYPNKLDGQAFKFSGELNDKDVIDFKLQLEQSLQDTSGDWATEIVSGISGSGVVFFENNNLYLLGLVNNLLSHDGTFNICNCSTLVPLYDAELFDFSELISFKDVWRKFQEIEEKIDEQKYAEFQVQNNTYFNHMDRKHKTIFNDNEVRSKNMQRLDAYLNSKWLVSEISSEIDSNFKDELNDLIQYMIQEIQISYSIEINSKRDGQEDLRGIQKTVSEYLADKFVSLKDNIMMMNKLRDYIVAQWLLNCDVNFKLEEKV